MSPRTSEQNEIIRNISRVRLLEVALNLFAQQGYEATSVRMIAQAAGIAQGLLYNYFDSKDALLRAVVQQSIDDVRDSFARAERAEAETSTIEQLIRAAFDIVKNKQAFWKLIYSVRMQPAVVADLGELYSAWSAEIRTNVAGYCHAAGLARPDIEGAILFAIIDGVAQQYVLDPEHYPLDDVTTVLIARYNRSLGEGVSNASGVA